MFKKTFVILAAAAVAAIGALSFWQGDFNSIRSSHAVSVQPAAVQSGRVLPDFASLVDQVGPAVVNIRTTERVRLGQGGPDEEMQEFLRRFFGGQIPPRE